VSFLFFFFCVCAVAGVCALACVWRCIFRVRVKAECLCLPLCVCCFVSCCIVVRPSATALLLLLTKLHIGCRVHLPGTSFFFQFSRFSPFKATGSYAHTQEKNKRNLILKKAVTTTATATKASLAASFSDLCHLLFLLEVFVGACETPFFFVVAKLFFFVKSVCCSVFCWFYRFPFSHSFSDTC
jgi:hypothetical protein